LATTIIRGGTIVTDYSVFRADLVLKDGRIAAITDDPDLLPRADEQIDATGKLVLPGGIDPHVHAGEPGWPAGGDFGTETMNAAAGGITTFMEHPLSLPATSTAERVREKQRLAEEKAYVDFGLWGAIIPESLDHLEEMRDAGVRGFKAFMPFSEVYYPNVDDAQLLDAMLTIARFDGLVLVHAENAAMLAANLKRLQAAGRKDAAAHFESRPPFVEYEAVNRAIVLAKEAGVRLQVVHVSVPAAAEAVKSAKAAGQRVTMEVCLHHLVLDEEDYLRAGPYARCAPPIRARDQVNALWSYVLDGSVDSIISDQSAYTRAEKEAGWASIWDAPQGLQSIEVIFPLFLSESVHKRGLPLEAFARLTATNAARATGLYPRKGTILPGSDADLAIYDPDVEWHVDENLSFSPHKWTPLHGMACRGKVERTIVRGQTVFQDGQIVGPRGFGRYLPGVPQEARAK
jgi:allantoinase